jgi:1-acyl-sn-glycerol-3-phosphate acyltransferase
MRPRKPPDDDKWNEVPVLNPKANSIPGSSTTSSRFGNAGWFTVLHNAAAFIWAFLSTVVYGTVTILVSIFNTGFARRIAHLWCIHVLFFCGVRVRTIGAEKLSKQERYVFIANHSSFFDIPTLYAGLPFSLSFIAKKELFFIPFFGWGIAAIGHIWIDRENARQARKSITRAIGKLKRRSISLVLFPEGTRSITGEVAEFRRGSFTLAIEAGIPVVPVTVCGTRNVLPKKSLFFKPGLVTLVIGDPVYPAELAGIDKQKLSEIMRKRIIAGQELGGRC